MRDGSLFIWLWTTGSCAAAAGRGARPVQQNQWEPPEEKISVEIKQLARIHHVGHRIAGDPRKARRPGATNEKVHVSADAFIRLSCVSVPADEKGLLIVGFLDLDAARFNGQGERCATAKGCECRRALSDDGIACKLCGWTKACQAMGLMARKTRRYCPRTNGATEWIITTLLEEWGPCEVGAMYWTVLAPVIVNPGRGGQGSISA